ncbi:omh4 [Candida margitis]|uniref:omh4 n=1 Tax=Candida margitis TaxID=1775924 RepID=UPI00222683C9|nr:omh4 [Candida margitis]KAI5969591.1 omh4 [Candida margitis]
MSINRIRALLSRSKKTTAILLLLTSLILFTTLLFKDIDLLPNNDPYWINYKIHKPPNDDTLKELSEQKLETKIDSPFQYGCAIPNTDQQPRANAAFVMLCRNSEIKGVISSMKSMERHFNQWYNYPWVFLNNEEFSPQFKDAILNHTSAKVSFGLIDMQDWEFSKDIPEAELHEWIESQGDRELLYGNLKSYHKMCRFYSGKFYLHPLVKQLDWYWRVEPNIEFYCDLTYDPFIEMEKRGKKYGFNVMLFDLYYSIPGLFRHVQTFIKKHNIKVKSSWNLFALNSKWLDGEDELGVYDGIHNSHDLIVEIQDQIYLQKFLHEQTGKTDDVFTKYPYLTRRILQKSKDMPKLHEDRTDKEEYNLCHFWSNFEIARVDLFTSTGYQSFYQHLESAGGFYKERWGDAPVHSLAVGMFLDLNEVHYFRDIGYRHEIFVHCPANAPEHQLEYVANPNYVAFTAGDGDTTQERVISPDKPRYNGVGCRCKCPQEYDDIENTECMKRWQKYTQDDYRDPEPVNLESWKKRLTRKIKHHLIAGGSMEEDLV